MDGDPSLLRTMEDVLSRASKAGVTKIVSVCSLVGGYSEGGRREHWTTVVQAGPTRVATARGRTQDDAIVSALQSIGVSW